MSARYPLAHPGLVTSVLATATGLQEAASTLYRDQPNTAASLSLSLRQLLRIARHASVSPGTTPGTAEFDAARVSVCSAVKEVGWRRVWFHHPVPVPLLGPNLALS